MPQTPDRRERVHRLVVALLASQAEIGLLEEEGFHGQPAQESAGGPAWLERNRRQVQRYQALVRTAVTLDALIEQEIASDQLGGP